MANSDLPHFTQVWRLNSELVLHALFKVVFVVIESPFTLNNKTFGQFFQINFDFNPGEKINSLSENSLCEHIKKKTPKNRKSLLCCNLPVSPNSPKILMKTSASVPLPFMSAVKTLTVYLLSGKLLLKILRAIKSI